MAVDQRLARVVFVRHDLVRLVPHPKRALVGTVDNAGIADVFEHRLGEFLDLPELTAQPEERAYMAVVDEQMKGWIKHDDVLYSFTLALRTSMVLRGLPAAFG